MKAYMVMWPMGEKLFPQLFFFMKKEKAQEVVNSFNGSATTPVWPQLVEIEISE